MNNVAGNYLLSKEVRQLNSNPSASHTTENEKLLNEK